MDKIDQQMSLKDFQIIRDLGSGSYGRVQLVKRKSDQKYYAMKSMFLANAKQKQKSAALNEIRLLASINMPYVISYKSSFYVQDIQSLCIVMEYADGGDLEGMITSRLNTLGYNGFDQQLIWKTAHQILKGLKGLHENNIIHRDLKCANIFFVNGVAKIGDLNISKITDNGFATTQTGTPYYTSPEIWKGQKYDSKCDIWALGCMIYEMCALLPPFRADDFPGLFAAVTAGKYDEIHKKYTKNLKEFITQCLKCDPLTRPSAASLLEKPYFAQFELSTECLSNEFQEKKSVKLIDPIECPKILKFLNQKLPRSQFEEQSKKTVGFIDHEHTSNPSFKIKTKKIRSQKTLPMAPTENTQKEQKIEKKTPKFILNKSSKQLPPLEKDKEPMKSAKSAKMIPAPPSSMKNIRLEKQNRRLILK